MSVRAKNRRLGERFSATFPRLCRSFCRRSAAETERLVSAASAYICGACIVECVAVLEKRGGFAGVRPVH
jgi:hypothetical protein